MNNKLPPFYIAFRFTKNTEKTLKPKWSLVCRKRKYDWHLQKCRPKNNLQIYQEKLDRFRINHYIIRRAPVTSSENQAIFSAYKRLFHFNNNVKLKKLLVTKADHKLLVMEITIDLGEYVKAFTRETGQQKHVTHFIQMIEDEKPFKLPINNTYTAGLQIVKTLSRRIGCSSTLILEKNQYIFNDDDKSIYVPQTGITYKRQEYYIGDDRVMVCQYSFINCSRPYEEYGLPDNITRVIVNRQCYYNDDNNKVYGHGAGSDRDEQMSPAMIAVCVLVTLVCLAGILLTYRFFSQM